MIFGGTINPSAGTHFPFEKDIVAGSRDVFVVFEQPFAVVPKVIGLTIEKLEEDADDIFVTSIRDITTDGFTARLSSYPENDNLYVLHGDALSQ